MISEHTVTAAKARIMSDPKHRRLRLCDRNKAPHKKRKSRVNLTRFFNRQVVFIAIGASIVYLVLRSCRAD